MEWLECESLIDPKDALHTWRKRAWDRFSEIGMPRPKQEAFQYISFKDFELPTPVSLPAVQTPAPFSLLFVDGFFQGADLPSPLVALSLKEAMRTYGLFLQSRWVRSLKEEKDPFAALNGALHGSGAFLYVPPHTRIEQPIEIHHLFTSSALSSPRLHIVLGKGASLQIIQRTTCQDPASFCNGYVDVSLEEGATLFYGEKQDELSSTSRHFQSLYCTLKRDSRFHSFALSQGALLSRSLIKVQLLEENSEALLQGLWKLNEKRECHANVLVEHIAPHCRSRQHFKSVLKDKSRSSFEGKILVRPEAQKTAAYQLNNNLLLSDEAAAHAKPNLEIFADDVKASHGATIAQPSEEELFYLRSRGLTLADAKEALITGFCNELLEEAPECFHAS